MSNRLAAPCSEGDRCYALFDGERLAAYGWYSDLPTPIDEHFVLHFDRVLQRLLADAWRHGAAAVRGRLDPRFVQEHSARHCWLRTDGTWTLVHSRHADVMAAIQQGDAFLSRLEGEWWLRFHG